MYCSKCGKENADDSAFCGYCGNSFNEIVATPQKNSLSAKDAIDLAYYKADLDNQRQIAAIQEQQLKTQKKMLAQEKKQYSKMAKCPKCGSTSLSGNKKGFGIGKAIIGAALIANPIGLVAGNIGAKKVYDTCMKCGKRFKA